MIGIYKIENNVTGESYIGQSCDIERRWTEHRTPRNLEKGTKLGNAILEYGIENFTFSVIAECSKEELDELEKEAILKYRPAYNTTVGGKGSTGHVVSKETRKRLSEISKKQWDEKTVQEKESIINNNLTHRFEKGREVTHETREKLRTANLGKKQSQETKNKRSERMKKAMKGNQNRKRQVMAVYIDTLDVEVFNMVIEAARHIKTDPTHLAHVLKKKKPICKGWYLAYLGSVETIGDECSQVGLEIGTSSKCVASRTDEEIVHSSEMENLRVSDKGFIQLAIRSNQFEGMNVVEVRDGELKGYDLITGEMLFEAQPNREKLPVVGYAAYIKLKNGFRKITYMTKEEMEVHAKRYSQTYKSQDVKTRNASKWTTDFDAMAKKTAIKNLLSHWAPLSVQMQEAQRVDQAVLHQDNKLEYVDNNDDPIAEAQKEISDNENSQVVDLGEVDPETGEIKQQEEQNEGPAPAPEPEPARTPRNSRRGAANF